MNPILLPKSVPSNEYAITITLSRKQRDRYDIAEDQYDALLEQIKLWCEKSKLQVSLITEFTKDFRIHFHGYIRHRNIELLNKTYRNNILRYFNESVRKFDIGFICVKPIDNENKWHTYCCKELNNTDNSLHRHVVSIDNLKKFEKEYYSLRFGYDRVIIKQEEESGLAQVEGSQDA